MDNINKNHVTKRLAENFSKGFGFTIKISTGKSYKIIPLDGDKYLFEDKNNSEPLVFLIDRYVSGTRIKAQSIYGKGRIEFSKNYIIKGSELVILPSGLTEYQWIEGKITNCIIQLVVGSTEVYGDLFYPEDENSYIDITNFVNKSFSIITESGKTFDFYFDIKSERFKYEGQDVISLLSIDREYGDDRVKKYDSYIYAFLKGKPFMIIVPSGTMFINDNLSNIILK